MRRKTWHILSFLLLNAIVAPSQLKLSRTSFFEDDKPLKMDLTTDLKKLVTDKKLDQYQPATAVCYFNDSSIISEEVQLSARGNFRRENCYIPSIKLDFSNPTSPRLSCLRKLKLVCGCDTRTTDERLILKEFLVYKIYNLVTDLSFRVRMLHINYRDTKGKIRPFTQYGFLIEDVDELAGRNNCYEVEGKSYHTEWTNRNHMTIVAVFQYMIGNLDWAVSNYHNIKLVRPLGDSTSSPFTVPYDFDFSGLVDAPYASPPEQFPLNSVRERLYRGFPRNMEEVQKTLDIFREKREAIKDCVMNFELLDLRYRKEIISYFDEFYKTIENKTAVKKIFIDNARKN